MKFYAALFVWNEEDIIGATVRNIYAQGADKVFIIDNGSTDATVKQALAAGARLAHTLDTGFFDEKVKYTTLNAVISAINAQSGEERIWWMIVDADEFPDSRLPVTIREFLASRPGDVRLVPADVMNHAPTHPPYYAPGYHPIDFQPLIVSKDAQKLPLLRYDKGTPHIFSMGGAHTYSYAGGYLTGTEHRLTFHHFKYRTPEKTLARLRQLTAEREDGTRRVDPIDSYGQRVHGHKSDYWNRLANIEAVYRERANAHISEYDPRLSTAHIKRWYEPEKIRLDPAIPREEAFFCLGSLALYRQDVIRAEACFKKCRLLAPDNPAYAQALALSRGLI